MRIEVIRGALAVGLTAASASVARGNPADAFGFGARGAAMGGAQAAAADDATANYYNPALLARLGDIRLDLGYQLAVPSLRVDGRDLGVDLSRGVTAALAVPGRLGALELAFGAGVFLPDQQLTRTRTLSAQQPRFALYDNRPQRLLLTASIAVALGDRVSAGAGIAYMSSTAGTVDLRGRVGFPDPNTSDLDLSIDVDLRTIRYPQLGVAVRVLPWLDVAVSYRGGFRLILDQRFALTGDVGAPGSPPAIHDGFLVLRARSQDLFQPAQLTAGGWARLTPRLGLAFDLAWHRWSAFENPAAQIDLDLDLRDFNDLVKIPPRSPLTEARFHDIAIPRLGVEWLVGTRPRHRILARAGYVYEPSPAPEQIGETNFIDNDKHTLSLGGGLELPGVGAIVPKPLTLDAFVAVTLLEPRNHRKLSAVDPIGDYRSTGTVVATGITSRWRF